MLCWLTFLNIVLLTSHMAANPYKQLRSNRSESVSLALLALLSSVLATLTPPYSYNEAVGLGFITILPAIGFAMVIAYNQLSRLGAVVNRLRGVSTATQPKIVVTHATSPNVPLQDLEDNDRLRPPGADSDAAGRISPSPSSPTPSPTSPSSPISPSVPILSAIPPSQVHRQGSTAAINIELGTVRVAAHTKAASQPPGALPRQASHIDDY
jgi:hypothetical protein